jgi:predicted RNA-binding protein with PIN domain
MPLELLIDGYNVIRQSPSLSRFDALDLEQGREALLAKLAAYRRVRNSRITVVFDGWGNPHLSSRDTSQRGITVVFTKGGENADQWIKKKLGTGVEGVVVSSDREIRDYAARVGVPSISSKDFDRKMEEALYYDMKGIEPEGKETTEYGKKGPSRRLSKKEKKMKSIMEKL